MKGGAREGNEHVRTRSSENGCTWRSKLNTPGTPLALFYPLKWTHIYGISTCFAVVQDKMCDIVVTVGMFNV